MPTVIVRDCLLVEEALSLEIALISILGRAPGQLVNMTAGGDGVVDRDPILNQEQSDRVKKRFQDPAERAAQSERIRRHFEKPGVREDHSKRQRERLADPETREKMRAARLGKKLPEAVIKKQKVSQKRRWDSDPSRKERARVTQLLRYTDPEERRRTGDAIKAGQTAEGRLRTNEGIKRRWSDPDERTKSSDQMKGNQYTKGRIWVNDGNRSLLVLPTDVPEGWGRGRLPWR